MVEGLNISGCEAAMEAEKGNMNNFECEEEKGFNS
jgi:hypothetical protein